MRCGTWCSSPSSIGMKSVREARPDFVTNVVTRMLVPRMYSRSTDCTSRGASA